MKKNEYFFYFLYIIIMVVIFIVFVIFIIYLISNPELIKSVIYKLIFFPQPAYGKININNMTTIKSKNGNKITYFTYYSNKENKDKKVIVWSHGNAMNAYHLEYYLKNLLLELDVDIISYDYQGYGFSEGIPKEQTCYEDLSAVIDSAKQQYKKIYLVGHSIGTGVITHYVSTNKWDTPIMLISPYKSIISIVTDKISENIRNLVYMFDVFSTIDKIKNINCKIKIIHGIDDKLISCQHSKDIYRELKDVFKIDPIFIENTGHNDILDKIDIKEFKELIFS